MKSNILLFSTRDIGINDTIFEKVISSQISENMCKYFFETNKKELTVEKKKHVSPTDKTNLPEIGVVKEIIKEGNGGKLPTQVTIAQETASVKELIEIAVNTLKKVQIHNNEENRTKAISTLQSYLNNEIQFEENDFKNPDVWKWKSAVNIDKRDKTIKDRISIYKTAEEICKVKEGGKEKNVFYQILAVWSLGKPDKDKDSVSWLDTLVKSVVELVQRNEQNEAVNEIEMYVFLHDKDLESICNVPFKTFYTKTQNFEGINITYTLISFTHADKEYDQIKNSKNIKLSELYEIVKKLANDSYVFQNLLELSDIIAQWEDKNKRNDFINKLKELKNLVGEEEWITSEWADLSNDSDSLIKAVDNVESCGGLLLDINCDINRLIKNII